MREIKFRAWDKGQNKMVEIRLMNFTKGTMMPCGWNMWFGDETLSEPMQYTGLKDKNGREIYEGDMLRVIDPNGEENRLCIVEWDAEGGCYSYEPDGGYGDFDVSAIGWAMSMEFEFEVIGNIHENPELPKGETP